LLLERKVEIPIMDKINKLREDFFLKLEKSQKGKIKQKI